MKKRYLLIILLSVLFIDVNAKTMTLEDISRDSYVIGNVLYTYDQDYLYEDRFFDDNDFLEERLTTKVIMKSMKLSETSEGTTLYYKGFDGNWDEYIENVTNVPSTSLPASFDIWYINGICIDARCLAPSSSGGDNYFLNFLDGSDSRANLAIVPISKTYLGTDDEMVLRTKIGEFSLPPIAKPGYKLLGWTLSEEESARVYSVDEIKNMSITEDIVFYAKWQAINYIFEYDANGGIAHSALDDSICNMDYANALVNFTSNSDPCKFKTPTDLEKDGYTFAGWSTDANGNGTVYKAGESVTSIFDNYNSVEATSRVKLYAVWKENTYDLIYRDGDVSKTIATYTYSTESQNINVILPSKTGYTLTSITGTGVTYNADSSLTIEARKTGNITLSANYRAHTYSFTLNGKTVTCTYDSECNLYATGHHPTNYLEAPVVDGARFVNFYIVDGGQKVYLPEKVTNFTATDGKSFTVKLDYVYSISYTLNGGVLDEEVNPSEYSYDLENPTKNMRYTLVSPTRAGYTFNGWTVSSNARISATNELSFNGPGKVTVTANWTANSISATFDGANRKNFTYGATNNDNLPVEPTHSKSLIFEGWLCNGILYAADSQLTDVNLFMTNGTTYNFTAKYVNNDAYKISYNLMGGTLPADAVTSVSKGDSVTSLPTPTKDGNTFLRWVDESDNAVTSVLGTRDITLKAVWETATYTIHLNKSSGGHIAGTYEISCTYGQACSLATATSEFDDATNTLVGWSKIQGGPVVYGAGVDVYNLFDESGHTLDLYAVTKDTNTYYNVSYYLDGGTLNPSVSLENRVTPNCELTLPNITKTGYMFLGWDVNGSLRNIGDTITITSDTLVVAKFTSHYSTVTFVDGSDVLATEEVEHGHKATSFVPTKEGYLFDKWLDSSNNVFDFDTEISSDITLSARWNQVFTVTFNDGGTTLTTQTVVDGQQATSFVPTKDGFIFNNWLDSSNNVFVFTTPITQNITLNASWTAIYSIEYQHGIGSAQDGGLYPATYTAVSQIYDSVNDTLLFSNPVAPINNQYEFARWKITDADGVEISASDYNSLAYDIVAIAQWNRVYELKYTVGLNGESTTHEMSLYKNGSAVTDTYTITCSNSDSGAFQPCDNPVEGNTAWRNIKRFKVSYDGKDIVFIKDGETTEIPNS